MPRELQESEGTQAQAIRSSEASHYFYGCDSSSPSQGKQETPAKQTKDRSSAYGQGEQNVDGF